MGNKTYWIIGGVIVAIIIGYIVYVKVIKKPAA